MVSVQVPCTVEEALVLMHGRARTSHLTLEEVAAAIVDRNLRFD
jgi:hypothetical protein